MEHQPHTFLTGVKKLAGQPDWWRGHIGEYLYIYCEQGEARLMLLGREYTLQKGGLIIASPDMFPAQVAASDDFRISFCAFNTELADKSSFDVPKEFFDCIYAQPVLPTFEGLTTWMQLFRQVGEETANPNRQAIVADLLHAFTLEYFEQWKLCFGETPKHYERSNTDRLCIDFYNLLLEHYREHRDIAFYASQLCITPNYLAMILRKQCGESPKAAIDRQLMIALEYQLRNTSLTIAELARIFHFPDPSYLCRYFRRHTGLSLSEYRRKVE